MQLSIAFRPSARNDCGAGRGFGLNAWAQQAEPTSLLQAAKLAYSEARSYRIEVERSENFTGELSGNWCHSFQIGIVAKGGRYRFEAVGPEYSWIQVSNGKFEWIYDAETERYLQRRTPADHKPRQFGDDEPSYDESKIADAREIPENIVEEIGEVRDPQVVGSEVLSLKNSSVDCFVVRGPGKYKSGWSPDTELERTFWLEKRSNYVRKIEQRWKGRLLSGKTSRYEREIVDRFNVAELDDSAVPAEMFNFRPPTTAKLVEKFTTIQPSLRKQPSIVGTIAPDVIFRSATGQVVSLSSMRGKPVMIEFWATWCSPCISAFPMLGKLYSELGQRGVVIITVDEDEESQEATSFLAKHGNISWPNYHDDGEINRLLPGEGLPQFVLIDAAGKIIFATSGFDEQMLRKEINGLTLRKRPNQ